MTFITCSAAGRLYPSAPATPLLVSWPMEKPARPALQNVDWSKFPRLGHLSCAADFSCTLPCPGRMTFIACSVADHLCTTPPAIQLLVSWPVEKPARPALQYVDWSKFPRLGHLSCAADFSCTLPCPGRMTFIACSVADHLCTTPPAIQLLVSWPMEKPARPALQNVDWSKFRRLGHLSCAADFPAPCRVPGA
ncbi:uncharacterized protein [Dermacentor albipictus]|uniref:uncharacterized protein n=1 Tax=Dermacentor albipictus TaxID=60249 RepID=UPI0031FE3098